MNNRSLVGQYAGFVTRAVGLIIDIAVVMAAILILYWTIALPLIFFLNIEPQNCITGQVTIRSVGNQQMQSTICGVTNLLWFFVTIGAAPVYFVFFVSATGQTIGHYLMGVRVVHLDGHRMTVWSSFVRYIGLIVAMIPCGLGYFWVLIDDRRQGWHDKMAKTCVVYAWQAEQNEFTLDRVRSLLKRGSSVIRHKDGSEIQKQRTAGRNYDLVTIAFQDYDRLDDVLNLIQSSIAKGHFTVVNATVLVKGESGQIGVLGASDLAVGNKISQVSTADLDVPEYELKIILEDIPNDSFVVAVVLEEEWADDLTKVVARALPVLIRRHDLGASPLPARAIAARRSAHASHSVTPDAEEATLTPHDSVPPAPAIDLSGVVLVEATSQPQANPSVAEPVHDVEQASTADVPVAASPALTDDLVELRQDITLLRQQIDAMLADRAALRAQLDAPLKPPAAPPPSETLPAELGHVEDQLAALHQKLDSALSANAAVNALVESQLGQQKTLHPSQQTPADELDLVRDQLAAINQKLDSALAERTNHAAEPGEQSPTPAEPAQPTPVPARAFQSAAALAATALGIDSQTTATLQDLADVVQIGTVYEQRLYRAGVGTFWELAHVDDDDFERILHLTDLQRQTVSFDTIRTDARRLAEATNTVGLIWQGETPDDFEPIQGIGTVFEQRLYDAGIRTYRALAAATPEQLAAVCHAHKPLEPDYAGWIRQAQQLIEPA